MIKDKKLLAQRTYSIADSLNINQITVNKIINTYSEVLKEEVYDGKEVNIYGLATIVPSNNYTGFVSTLALHAKRTSEKCSISYYTCLTVLNEYLDDVRKSILNGENANIRGVVTFAIVVDTDGSYNIHASVSSSIRKDLIFKSSGDFTVRVHTSKLLKSQSLHKFKMEGGVTIDRQDA